jgi:hypothetical protein
MIVLAIFAFVLSMGIIIENGSVGLLYAVVFLLISVPVYILSVYSINCLTKGSCETWSWILVIINSVFTFIIILASIVSSLSKGGTSNNNNSRRYERRAIAEDY